MRNAYQNVKRTAKLSVPTAGVPVMLMFASGLFKGELVRLALDTALWVFSITMVSKTSGIHLHRKALCVCFENNFLKNDRLLNLA